MEATVRQHMPPSGDRQHKGREIGICLATLSFYPLYAGPALRFQRYAPGLAQRGGRMRVFTGAVTDELIARDGALTNGSGSPKAGGHTKRALFEIVDGLPVQRIELPSGRWQQVTYFRHLAHYCREHRSEIDVVQLLHIDLLAAPWLHQLRRLGIATVFTHTLLADLSPLPWKRMVQRIHRRLPLNLVDAVVVSSREMRRQLTALGVKTPVQVIPNGVDLQRFRPISSADAKARLRQQLGLDPAGEIVLAIGPIIPRKGVDVLVEAFVTLCAEFPQTYLVLVGPRHDLARENLAEFHRHLRSTIEAAGADERVIFTGAVSNVQDYLRAADILVFASRREGMPNVVPEAMACALPIVMTPFLGLPDEFGQPGAQYVLSDWNPRHLANDLRTLLEDPQRRTALGRAARQWIEEKLDVNQSLDAYMDLYRSLV